MVFTLPMTMEGEEDTRPATFALDLTHEAFRALYNNMGTFDSLVTGIRRDTEEDEEPGEADCPLHPEGPCPECDATSGIRARGPFRNCTNCGFRWRVS